MGGLGLFGGVGCFRSSSDGVVWGGDNASGDSGELVGWEYCDDVG